MMNGVSKVPQKALSYAFSGAGWLFPFHLGVVSSLRKQNLIDTNCTVAGSSGGAITAALCSVGLCEHDALARCIDSSKNFKVKSNIDTNLRKMLRETIPPDAFTTCNGKLNITITELYSQPKLKVVSQYDSNDDLINCIATSCYIPFYCGPDFSVSFRDKKCIDGAVFAFVPPMGDITVNPIPSIGNYVPNPRRSTIHPNLVPGFNVPLRKMIWRAFSPASPEELRQLFDIGVAAADIWGHSQTH